MLCLCDSVEGMETLELTESTVNPGPQRAGPQDFQLLKVLGKGGYGKVSPLTHSLTKKEEITLKLFLLLATVINFFFLVQT